MPCNESHIIKENDCGDSNSIASWDGTVFCVSRLGGAGTGFAEEKSSTEGCQSCTGFKIII